MKITFSNLGAIKKTTLDLRPLTVIIGPNNSSNDNDYAALTMNNSEMKIGIKESGNNFVNKIEDDLTKLGLKSDRHFTIEKID